MLHQCGHQSSPYPCSCGSAYFSGVFPATGKQSTDEDHGVARSGCSSPSSVDCTLSLGTPSTRQTGNKAAAAASSTLFQRPSWVSSFGQDVMSQSKKRSNALYGGAASGSTLGGDPLLLARRCANCDTTSTPLWRNGPRGPKSLCNACGIRYKKEERRAAASMAPPSSSSSSAATSAAGETQLRPPWSCYDSSATRGSSSSTTYDETAGHGEASSLTWEFNVAAPSSQFSARNRPSLSQYH
ncbi:GATA zinc finger domain containing protein [Musa troglodytarum]|uniref:GATA zinc finger domain containing protein n=1 Tax=Musa troglodytarum TaxID=320322 RepID=A0A9E7E9E9_9LILI|nr:GATA zinc finger domain containing protein [Musa troglodytarum]